MCKFVLYYLGYWDMLMHFVASTFLSYKKIAIIIVTKIYYHTLYTSDPVFLEC